MRDANSKGDWVLNVISLDIYRNNAYRQLRLPVDASQKIINSTVKQVEFALAHPRPVVNASENQIYLPYTEDFSASQASQRLHNPELRLVDDFFWFWPLHFDHDASADEAFQMLKTNETGAVSIWQRQLQQGNAGIAAHNLAVFHHMKALDVERDNEQPLSDQQQTLKVYNWNEACQWWRTCINDEVFWAEFQDRIRKLPDLWFTGGRVQQLRDVLPVALASINSTIALRAAARGDEAEKRFQLQLISSYKFDQAVIDRAKMQSVAPLREEIHLLCQSAEVDGAKNPEQACKVSQDLLNHVSEPLYALDQLFPDGLAHDEVHDKVASMLEKNGTLVLTRNDNFEGLQLLESAREIAGSKTECKHIEERLLTVTSGTGRKLSSESREKEAIPFLKKAVELEDSGVNNHWLGSTLANLNRGNEAVPYLQRAVELRGEYLDYRWLGHTLLDLHRQEEAVPYLKRVVELQGDEIETVLLLNALFELKREEEAIPYLKTVADRENSASSSLALGKLLTKSGRYSEALPYLKTAVELSGENIDYHWYGVTLLQLNRKQEAVPYLKRAVELKGDETDYLVLTNTLAELGQMDEAVKWLRKGAQSGVVSVDPNILKAAEHLASQQQKTKKRSFWPWRR